MKEHYGVSQAQLRYLNGQDMPKSFNKSKEQDRIIRKAKQAWDIFVPVLRSKVVDQEFKDSLFEFKRFEDFLTFLLKTERGNTISQEINKMRIAKIMIQKGTQYYQTRYQLNQIINEKIAEINSVLGMIQEFVDQELYNIEVSDFLRMRRGLTAPPIVQQENDLYHALCIQCYRYSLGLTKSEKEAIKDLQHDNNCSYKKQFKTATKNNDEAYKKSLILQYIKTIPPKNPIKNK